MQVEGGRAVARGSVERGSWKYRGVYVSVNSGSFPPKGQKNKALDKLQNTACTRSSFPRMFVD